MYRWHFGQPLNFVRLPFIVYTSEITYIAVTRILALLLLSKELAGVRDDFVNVFETLLKVRNV